MEHFKTVPIGVSGFLCFLINAAMLVTNSINHQTYPAKSKVTKTQEKQKGEDYDTV
jgi:hypothetical protein